LHAKSPTSREAKLKGFTVSQFTSRSVHTTLKVLCKAVMICASLVNMQTDRQTHPDTQTAH